MLNKKLNFKFLGTKSKTLFNLFKVYTILHNKGYNSILYMFDIKKN